MHKKWFKIIGLVFKAGLPIFHAQNRSNQTVYCEIMKVKNLRIED
jgi:hypothetical protein